MKYYGIHVTNSENDSDGYTIAVSIKDGTEEDAVQKAIDQDMFVYSEDAKNIDYIEELDRDEYEDMYHENDEEYDDYDDDEDYDDDYDDDYNGEELNYNVYVTIALNNDNEDHYFYDIIKNDEDDFPLTIFKKVKQNSYSNTMEYDSTSGWGENCEISYEINYIMNDSCYVYYIDDDESMCLNEIINKNNYIFTDESLNIIKNNIIEYLKPYYHSYCENLKNNNKEINDHNEIEFIISGCIESDNCYDEISLPEETITISLSELKTNDLETEYENNLDEEYDEI